MDKLKPELKNEMASIINSYRYQAKLSDVYRRLFISIHNLRNRDKVLAVIHSYYLKYSFAFESFSLAEVPDLLDRYDIEGMGLDNWATEVINTLAGRGVPNISGERGA